MGVEVGGGEGAAAALVGHTQARYEDVGGGGEIDAAGLGSSSTTTSTGAASTKVCTC